jgi:hypothetical protein
MMIFIGLATLSFFTRSESIGHGGTAFGAGRGARHPGSFLLNSNQS